MFNKIAKKIISEFFYQLYYKFNRSKFEATRDGIPLKLGISASVIVKNEAYNIQLCLQSLVGFVDQIVCIDNGSIDDTYKKIIEFKDKYNGDLLINILQMPNSLMAECRDKALELSKHQWHLRWDSDCIAQTSGINNISYLRDQVLNNNKPTVYQLPRIDLVGDLRHYNKFSGYYNQGENCLIRYNKNLKYSYYKSIKWETIKIPLYYQLKKIKKYYYFHCDGSKSDENLIHRFHYFYWVGLLNNCKNEIEKKKIGDFESFKNKRNKELFQTECRKAIKFRYQRQLVIQLNKYIPEKAIEYPNLIQEKIDKSEERFRVTYKDGKPYYRIDNEDQEMLNYQPTEEDIAWDPLKFLEKFWNKEQIEKLKENLYESANTN